MPEEHDSNSAMPAIHVSVTSDGWAALGLDLEALCHQMISMTVEHIASGAESVAEHEVSVAFADDAFIRDLNRTYRGIDAPTNVLAFTDDSDLDSPHPPQLGDLVIAFETVVEEATAQHKDVSNHLRHLIVHGVLHLLGYDHEADDQAEVMESLERDILGAANVPDPYRGDHIGLG